MEQAQMEYSEMDIEKVNQSNFLNGEVSNLLRDGVKT